MNFRLLNIVIILFSLVLLSFIIYISINILKQYPSEDVTEISEFTAIKVIDGDTFQLYNNQIIRLICVDTPEENEEGYEEAKVFLENLILNNEVRLESDIDDKDQYGRLLRYVYVEENGSEVFVNRDIVKNGFGEVFPYGNSTRLCNDIGS